MYWILKFWSLTELFLFMEPIYNRDELALVIPYGPDPFPLNRPIAAYGSPDKSRRCLVCYNRHGTSRFHRHHSSFFLSLHSEAATDLHGRLPLVQIHPQPRQKGGQSCRLNDVQHPAQRFHEPRRQDAVPHGYWVHLRRHHVGPLASLEENLWAEQWTHRHYHKPRTKWCWEKNPHCLHESLPCLEQRGYFKQFYQHL